MTYVSEVMADVPRAYYRFNETSGTTLEDSSGNARNGTYISSASLGGPSLAPGIDGTSGDFSSSSTAYGATVPHDSWMVDTEAFSVDFLVRVDATASWTWFAGSGDASGGLAWDLYYYPGLNRLYLLIGGANATVIAPMQLVLGETYHVAATWNGTAAKVYVNGILVGSANGSAGRRRDLPLPISIHYRTAYPTNLSYRGRCIIDEFAFYGTELSAARVKAHYEAAYDVPTPVIADPRSIPGLRFWYSAEAETGYADGANMTQWTDQSGNNLHATAAGTSVPKWQAATGPGGGPSVRFPNSVAASGGWFTIPVSAFTGRNTMELHTRIKADAVSRAGTWSFVNSGNQYYPYGPATQDRLVYEGYMSFTAPMSLTEWRNYQYWFGNNVWRVLMDGVLARELVNLGVPTFMTSSLYLGRSGTYNFQGNMSLIVAYNRVLTPLERRSLDQWTAANPAGGVPYNPPVTVEGRAATINVEMHRYVPPVTVEGRSSTINVSAPAGSSYRWLEVYGRAPRVNVDAGVGFPDVAPMMGMSVLDSTLIQAPTAVQVMVVGAPALTTVTFEIDGVQVWSTTSDSGGFVGPVSVPVPEAQGAQGEHTIVAKAVGARETSGTFTLKKAPEPGNRVVGPDADPVAIPAAETSTGVYRWVMQDLMPGGLGSFVMPANPSAMTAPNYQRTLEAMHSTAASGSFHIFETGLDPIEWEFSGYCPDQATHDQLVAFGELNRRFYVIDHRNRAWIVTFVEVELVARKRQRNNDGTFNDWAHDYTVRAIVYDQDWRTPQ